MKMDAQVFQDAMRSLERDEVQHYEAAQAAGTLTTLDVELLTMTAKI